MSLYDDEPGRYTTYITFTDGDLEDLAARRHIRAWKPRELKPPFEIEFGPEWTTPKEPSK